MAKGGRALDDREQKNTDGGRDYLLVVDNGGDGVKLSSGKAATHFGTAPNRLGHRLGEHENIPLSFPVYLAVRRSLVGRFDSRRRICSRAKFVCLA